MTNLQEQAKSVFDQALELASPRDRCEFLEGRFEQRPELRRPVETLLQAYRDAGSFLESPPVGVAKTQDIPDRAEPESQQIGPYKLLQQIGEGGMGTVYMAEQTEPVTRRVALKIIKQGMDTKSVIARFEAERQALAMMDHPNIAKVLDAGATENGRPYFVMELVKGVPITEYCDNHRLTIRQRLELFMHVCQAVQHAHQKGIIHRDIKPSNVLVAQYDGKPVPKVIDFGVAKATNQRLTERTMFTEFGQIVGTLEYMSPEQAQLNQLDIDTRSDIYSLGVLLYELLTGATPFDGKRLRSSAFDEVLRILREEEPPKPSHRISTLGPESTQVSNNRSLEHRKLGTFVRGDLDWIVMKAMDKDRGRRYESAAAFAGDLRSFLANGLVVARSPSMRYRTKKYIARNKGLVAATLSILTVLVLWLITTTITTLRLNTTVTELHDLIIDRALTQVVDGDSEGLDQTIELGNRANLPMDWEYTLLGFQALQNGDNRRARSLFEKAYEFNPENVSAKGLNSWALLYCGDLESWSHHVFQTQANAQPRGAYHDFDEFFLGFARFYVDYGEARRSFDSTIEAHPSWMFARLMRASAMSHEAWGGSPDAELARQSLEEMESISGFLQDTNLVLLMKIFIYSSALYCDPDVDVARIKSQADPLAEKLAKATDFHVGTWSLLKYYELTDNDEGEAWARATAYRHNDGFTFLGAFEKLFGEKDDEAILSVRDRGDEVLLMQALVRGWNGDRDQAIEIARDLAERNSSWVMRHRIIWVYLVCEELNQAQELSKQWLADEQAAGSIRRMNSDRRAIEIVAHGEVPPEKDMSVLSPQHRLQSEFILGLIALSEPDRTNALSHFERAISVHDDWETTRYANAFATRLAQDLKSEAERDSDAKREKGQGVLTDVHGTCGDD